MWMSLCLQRAEVGIWGRAGRNLADSICHRAAGRCKLTLEASSLKEGHQVLTVPSECFCYAVSSSIPLSRLSILFSLDPKDDFNDFFTIIFGSWFWSANWMSVSFFRYSLDWFLVPSLHILHFFLKEQHLPYQSYNWSKSFYIWLVSWKQWECHLLS